MTSTLRSIRKLLVFLPFVVPIIYLAIVFWLHPPDHLGWAPDRAPWLGRLVYDDWDPTALALRGLNAHLGRVPGPIERPEGVSVSTFSRQLKDPTIRLGDYYYVEYPDAAVWLFRLPFLLRTPPPAPPAFLDAHYGDIAFHQPTGPEQQELWRYFRWVIQKYMIMMVCCHLLLLALLFRGYSPDGPSGNPIVLLILPGALYFVVNRFDVVPTLLVALSLACLGRQRMIASALFLAAATVVKVFPILLAPLILRYIWPDRRAALRWFITYGTVGLACQLPALLSFGLSAIWAPYHFQLTRPPMPPTAYGYILPVALEGPEWYAKLFRFGVLALVMMVLLLTKATSMRTLLIRSVLAVIVFISLPIFYSPQWILWLSPFLVPLARQSRAIFWFAFLLDLVTIITFPFIMDHIFYEWNLSPEELMHYQAFWPSLYETFVYLRFIVLGLLVLSLIWHWFFPGRDAEAQQRSTEPDAENVPV